MDNPSPYLQLRIPKPDKQALSFCDASLHGLTEWVAGLPKANLGETARLLYQCLVELNQLETPASNRMKLMELLRPEVLFVCKHLEKHFLNQSVVLDERPRKVANLCQALQNHLAIGYKLIVTQEASQFRKEQPQPLAIALQRSLHSMFGPLVRACQLYCPVPDGLWLEMHLVYRTAVAFNLQHIAVTDPLSHYDAPHSVENAYLAAMLLGCARTNQMRQNAIANLAEAIEGWAPLVHLQTADSPASLFWIAIRQDAPPRLKSLFKDSEKQYLLGINPTPLLDAIEEYLQADASKRAFARLPVTERLTPEQIQHLGAAWGDTAERTFRRIPAQGTMTICLGMSAVHYFLAGEKDFGDVLKAPDEPRNANFASKKKGAPDIWANSFDAQPVARWEPGEPMEEIKYSSPEALSTDSILEKYPVYELLIVNHSPSGYCLSWPREVPNQLQAGELLGIQDTAKQGWSVAVARWIRQVRGGGTQMGIELIAPSAQPCGLQLVRKAGESSQYLRALLLPEIKAISRPPGLITPRMPFQESNKVQINLNGAEKRAILSKKQTSTGSFSQFEYRDLTEANHGLHSALDTPKVAGEEDFDSLWKSL